MSINTFTFGNGDQNVGQKTKRFKAETGRTYRATFVWFTDYDKNGLPTEGANINFSGCERIYKQGVGYVVVTDSNRQAMIDLLKAQPKAAIGTVIVTWPTDKEGDLDAASYAAGKGWQVQSWVFSPDKYQEIGRANKRFPLTKHDVSMTCSDAQYQKMTFVSEGENLLTKYLNAKNEALRAVGQRIIADARKVANEIGREIGREMTVDEVREALGEEVSSPTGNHASKDVDSMLDGIIDNV